MSNRDHRSLAVKQMLSGLYDLERHDQRTDIVEYLMSSAAALTAMLAVAAVTPRAEKALNDVSALVKSLSKMKRRPVDPDKAELLAKALQEMTENYPLFKLKANPEKDVLCAYLDSLFVVEVEVAGKVIGDVSVHINKSQSDRINHTLGYNLTFRIPIKDRSITPDLIIDYIRSHAQ